ncbi:MAG: ATP-NAD kinase family protein [Candidatus Heimdallarchaeaceae archaeon]
MTLKIGFIVNPIAGLGGKKAWKGTDEIEEAWEFFEKGEKYSFERLDQALSSIPSSLDIVFYICGDPMGEEIINKYNFDTEKVYTPQVERTSATNTKDACKVFMDRSVDLILFVGGDGTARDVTSIIGEEIPALGIPSGVKMFSGCFLYRPKDLGEILDEMVNGEIIFSPEDIMDVDESMFRENKVQATLYGHLIVPQMPGLIQGGKISSSITTPETFQSISLELQEEHKILKGITILGTGSTVFHVLKWLNREKTLLGIDVLVNGEILHKDVNEEALFNLTKGKEIQIILTPIGGQGFLLGRGNQQISSRVLKNAKKFSLIIISPDQKLDTIEQLELDLDEPVEIPDIKNGFIKVLTGYHQYSLVRINVKFDN